MQREKVGDLGAAGGIIVIACILKLKDTGYEFVDWRYLSQGRVQWLAVVNTVMNQYLINLLSSAIVFEGSLVN